LAAVPVALDAGRSARSGNCATAPRAAIGKFAESIPAGGLSEEMRHGLVAVLQKNLADSSPGVRAKAVRSLGKLARYGHLTASERDQLKLALKRFWGRRVVRLGSRLRGAQEAKEALAVCLALWHRAWSGVNGLGACGSSSIARRTF